MNIVLIIQILLGILFCFPQGCVVGEREAVTTHTIPSSNAVVNRVKYTLILSTYCVLWKLAGISHPHAHIHSLTFLGPTELSQAVVDAGAIPLLVLCIQEPEIALKRIAASALSDISKHSPELAQTVVDVGAIAHLAQMILNPDEKLKVCTTEVKRQQTSQCSKNPRQWRCVTN